MLLAKPMISVSERVVPFPPRRTWRQLLFQGDGEVLAFPNVASAGDRRASFIELLT